VSEINYGKQEKRVIFHDSDHRHAKLKIKLKHDGLSQAQFFRAIVTGYLTEDERILDFVDEYKKENNVQSKDKIKKSRKLIDEGKQNIKNFTFEENEIENIFDLIEKEYPEL
tara:strand:+ start:25332 stop:25667 length:336 start_codon:yes stop_codon:yes gene_type:complete